MKNISIIFTGTVATTLADKILNAFEVDGYYVTAIFTEKAKYFIDMDKMCDKHFYIFDDKHEWKDGGTYSKSDLIPHIEFAKDDVLLIIASADFLAKMVNGHCDDLASSMYRAWHRYKPVIVAPAMNTHMWEHPITEKHIDQLIEWNVKIVYPQEKELACGTSGMGALADIETIKGMVEHSLDNTFPLFSCNGIPVGDKHPGAFLYPRKHAPHTGVDLYTTDNQPVYAMNDGKIISIEDFTGKFDGSDWWEDTSCILIEHWFGVVCYGEISPIGFNIGDYVRKYDKIGNVKRVLKPEKARPDILGHSTSMLHIELYPHGQKKASTTYSKDKDILRDPTPFLLACKSENIKVLN